MADLDDLEKEVCGVEDAARRLGKKFRELLGWIKMPEGWVRGDPRRITRIYLKALRQGGRLPETTAELLEQLQEGDHESGADDGGDPSP